MIALALVLAAASCSPHALTLKQAKALVLASPGVRTSVVQFGARPFFEDVTPGPDGWTFTVNADNPCAHPCSALLGRYSVNRRTGVVEDMDSGFDGQVVSSRRVNLLRRKMGCHL